MKRLAEYYIDLLQNAQIYRGGIKLSRILYNVPFTSHAGKP